MSHNLSIPVTKVEVEPSGYKTMTVDITVENYDAVLDQIENNAILKYIEHQDGFNTEWCMERVTIEECIEYFGVLEMRDQVAKTLIQN
jgi:hypothetical protein